MDLKFHVGSFTWSCSQPILLRLFRLQMPTISATSAGQLRPAVSATSAGQATPASRSSLPRLVRLLRLTSLIYFFSTFLNKYLFLFSLLFKSHDYISDQ